MCGTCEMVGRGGLGMIFKFIGSIKFNMQLPYFSAVFRPLWSEHNSTIFKWTTPPRSTWPRHMNSSTPSFIKEDCVGGFRARCTHFYGSRHTLPVHKFQQLSRGRFFTMREIKCCPEPEQGQALWLAALPQLLLSSSFRLVLLPGNMCRDFVFLQSNVVVVPGIEFARWWNSLEKC